ncbi:MAG: 2-succinyl-5-enolpyruvyl-6-hydroxy-3-cyclohexene-1-carboxylic-acid synthase, partial [Rhodothermales bacterium]
MSRPAPNINRFWANLIVEELIRNGIRRFFIAPGSRSSPLVAAVAQHPHAEAIVHFDERGTAFAALGFARATRQPAVWITTSGTAVANGLPAFVEASQSYVPLIALTADRPPELRDTGANQAIDQTRIFGTFARWFFDLPCPSAAIDPAFVLSTVDQAVHRAVDAPPGPVHLNCAYREPLAPSAGGVQMPELPLRWSGSHEPYTTYRGGTLDPDPSAFEELAGRLPNTRRGLLVVGELPSLEVAHAVSSLATRLQWPVLADVTSQMRLGDAGAPLVASPHFTCAHMLGGQSPEIILRMGGAISSKDIQRYVDTAHERVVSVSDYPERHDPGHRIAEVIRASTESFCRRLENVGSNIDPEWGMS